MKLDLCHRPNFNLNKFESLDVVAFILLYWQGFFNCTNLCLLGITKVSFQTIKSAFLSFACLDFRQSFIRSHMIDLETINSRSDWSSLFALFYFSVSNHFLY